MVILLLKRYMVGMWQFHKIVSLVITILMLIERLAPTQRSEGGTAAFTSKSYSIFYFHAEIKMLKSNKFNFHTSRRLRYGRRVAVS